MSSGRPKRASSSRNFFARPTTSSGAQRPAARSSSTISPVRRSTTKRSGRAVLARGAAPQGELVLGPELERAAELGETLARRFRVRLGGEATRFGEVDRDEGRHAKAEQADELEVAGLGAGLEPSRGLDRR